MSQNTVETGRTKAPMPEFRYDTTDGGQNLYDVMFSLFSRFSDDSVRSRTKAFSLANGASVTFAHNIGQPSNEIEVKVFIGGAELSGEQVSAAFVLSNPSNDSIVLENVSGANKSGWLVISACLHNRADCFRFRTRSAPPPVVPEGEVIVFSEADNIYAKNAAGTVMALTDSASIQGPPGVVLPYAGTVLPSGYLWCDGAAHSRATYSRLYAALGITHGQGDGTTTFNVPDYRGRFLRGVDGSASRDPDKASRTAMGTGGNTGNTVGSVQSGETNSHTHAQNSHNHTQDSHNHFQNAHGHTQDSHNHAQDAHNHAQDAHSHTIVTDAAAGIYYGTTIDTYTETVSPRAATTVGSTTATNQATTATNQATTATNQNTTATNNAVTATNQSTTATNQNTGGNETRPVNANVNFIIKY